MKLLSLAAGAAALVLAAGPALAEPPTAKAAAKAAGVSGPSQPVPYDQLNTAMKRGSAKSRAAKALSPEARTGAGTDTSATLGRPSESSVTPPPEPQGPPVDSPESGTVNPKPAPDTTSPPGVTPPDGSPRPR